MGCVIVILGAILVMVLFRPAPLMIVGALGGALTGSMIIATEMARRCTAIRHEKAERRQASCDADVELA